MTDTVINSHPGESGPSEMQPQPILAAREAKFNGLLTLLNFVAGNQDEMST